eukprot:364654-Chlamydomonas_euryale.AAC.10
MFERLSERDRESKRPRLGRRKALELPSMQKLVRVADATAATFPDCRPSRRVAPAVATGVRYHAPQTRILGATNRRGGFWNGTSWLPRCPVRRCGVVGAQLSPQMSRCVGVRARCACDASD